jgi:hypothetical protein
MSQHTPGAIRAAEELRKNNKALLNALRKVVTTCKAGVLERRETGKPTWYALDHLGAVATSAIARAEGREP